MSARDDFNSNARSPGGWGGQGNQTTQAGGGGHGSLGGGSGTNASGMGGLLGVGGGRGSNIAPGISAGGGLTGAGVGGGPSFDALASLFRGGKGGPSGQVGTVNPALRTRRYVNQPIEEVNLPPPAKIQEILNQNRPLTPAEQALVNFWRQNGGNAFRWRTQARPGANWVPNPSSPGFHNGTGPDQVPGTIPPNTGSGYTPQWDRQASSGQGLQDLSSETSWRNAR